MTPCSKVSIQTLLFLLLTAPFLLTAAQELHPLEEGRYLQFDVPTNTTPSYFSLVPSKKTSYMITVVCPLRDIIISACLTTAAGNNSTLSGELKFPTEFDYDYSSKRGQSYSIGSARLYIPGDSLLDMTRITLSVILKNPHLLPSDQDRHGFFKILATSESTKIVHEKSYYESVLEEHYAYFTFTPSPGLNAMLISLSSLDDGEIGLLVSYGSEQRPSIEDYQFASTSFHNTHLLELDETDMYPHSGIQGTWVIAVYGKKNSTFSLTVVSGTQKMTDMHVGAAVTLIERSKVFYKYYHTSEKPIVLTRVKGYPFEYSVFVNIVNEDHDLGSQLPTSTNASWAFNGPLNVFVINTYDGKFCSDCLYIFLFDNIKFYWNVSFTITQELPFVTIEAGEKYREDLGPQGLIYRTFSTEDLEENTVKVSLLDYRYGLFLDVYISDSPTVNSTNYIWTSRLDGNRVSDLVDLNISEYTETKVPKQFYMLLKNALTGSMSIELTASTKRLHKCSAAR